MKHGILQYVHEKRFYNPINIVKKTLSILTITFKFYNHEIMSYVKLLNGFGFLCDFHDVVMGSNCSHESCILL